MGLLGLREVRSDGMAVLITGVAVPRMRRAAGRRLMSCIFANIA